MVNASLIHSPLLCARIVVIVTCGPSARVGCRMARPLSVSGFRHASQQDAKSAYFDLKCGLTESFVALSSCPCAFDKAAKSFAHAFDDIRIGVSSPVVGSSDSFGAIGSPSA